MLHDFSVDSAGRERERELFYCGIIDIKKTALLSMRAALLSNFKGHIRMLLIQVLVVWDLELFCPVAFQKGCTHEQMAKVLILSHHR